MARASSILAMEAFFGGDVMSPNDNIDSHHRSIPRNIRRGVWSSSLQEEGKWIDALLLSAAAHHDRQQRVASDASTHTNVEIPKTVHFIWLGSNAIPSFPFLDEDGNSRVNVDGIDNQGETSKDITIAEGSQTKSQWNECMRSWKKHHPFSRGWQIHLWTEEDIIDTSNDSANHFDREKDCIEQPTLFELGVSNMQNFKGYQHAIENQNYGMASDILRLEILNKFGGVYVDIDYWCVDSLDDILTRPNIDNTAICNKPIQFFCGASNTGCVELNNGLMACRKGGHPILWNMMDSIHGYFEDMMSSPAAPTHPEQNSIWILLSSFLDTTSVNSLNASRGISSMEVIENTGPGLLTRSVCRWLVCNNEVAADCKLNLNKTESFDLDQAVVLPSSVFHPFPNHLRKDLSSLCNVPNGGNNACKVLDEKRNDSSKSKPTSMVVLEALRVAEETKAVHLWGCSWQNS